MVNSEHLKFIGWLINRLIYKHLYNQDDEVVAKLKDLQTDLSKDYNCDINNNLLDMILAKYYVDFNLEKSSDFCVGFTPKERENLRTTIRQIINDVVNKRINYQEPVIKG